MGFNSAIVINNDTLHHIDKDPVAWWNAVSPHLSGMQLGEVRHWSGTRVIQCDHADNAQVHIIGRYQGVYLGRADMRWDLMDQPEDRKVEILRSLARNMGYDLRKR